MKDLRKLNLEKVILFGSYAYGTPDENSDIDLYIVTKDDFIPECYAEKFRIIKKVYTALYNFRRKFASDIIVHTLPVHKKFIEDGSSFSREIFSRGIVLL